LWLKIFLFLAPSDVAKVAVVCRSFERLCYSNDLWSNFWQRRGFVPHSAQLRPEEATWRMKFRHFSGRVVKAGEVLRELPSAGWLSRTAWQRAWLIVAGLRLYSFNLEDKGFDPEAQAVDFYEKSKESLRRVLAAHHVDTTFRLVDISLSQGGAFFGAGKFQLIVEGKSQGDFKFACATDDERGDWTRALVTHLRGFEVERRKNRQMIAELSLLFPAAIPQAGDHDSSNALGDSLNRT